MLGVPRAFWVLTLLAAVGCRTQVPVDWEASDFVFAAFGENDGDFFGWSVAGVGDVNGDGFGDLVVGAPQFDGAAGAAYLYLGGPDGPQDEPAWTFKASQLGASFGHAVAAAGDVNGDGRNDVLVGAPRWDNGEVDEGRVFLFLGNNGGLGSNATWTIESNQVGAQLGFSVGGAGDTNNDGLDDVIAGGPRYDNSFADEGVALVWLGQPTGNLGTAPAWVAYGGSDAAAFGTSVSGAGDVDSDGFDDVIVGAPRATVNEDSEGQAFVFRGSNTGPDPTPVWITRGGQAGAQYGQSVAGVGDVDADGHDDVLVGAFSYDDGQTDEGAVFVYHGLTTGAGSVSSLPAWTQDGAQVGAFFGVSVAAAGFVDDDSRSDIVVGGYGFQQGQDNEGGAFVYFGAETQDLNVGPSFESNQVGSIFGSAVSGRSDVDGDGRDEIIVGAYAYDSADQEDVGRVFVYPVD